MKIVIIQDYLRGGGTEKQSVLLTNYLNQIGNTTTLITFRPRGPLREAVQDNQIRSLQNKDRGWDAYAPKLIKTLKKEAPDCILCMGSVANMYAGRIQRKLPEAHVIGTLRTGKSLPYFYRKSLKQVRSLLVNCQWWKSKLIQMGIPANKIEVIRNPIAIDISSARTQEPKELNSLRSPFKATHKTCIFLCVQGFRPGKRHRLLIESFNQLDKSQDWQLWLVGEGEERKSCEVLAKELDIQDKVHFLGYQKDPIPYYQAADVAVSVSKEDSFPNFLIEAQAYALPVIAVDTVGVSETFIPEKTGALIQEDDLNSFIKKAQKLLDNPTLRNQWGTEGQKNALDQFSPKIINEQIKAYFERRLKKPKQRVIVLARWLTYGDGVSNDALGMYYSLIDAGYNAFIVANEHHASLKKEPIISFKKLTRWDLTEEDIVIYHFTSGWAECFNFLKTAPCKKVLRYQNITPPHFFGKYSPTHARRCEDGYTYLRQMHTISWELVLAPSAFNIKGLVDNGVKKDLCHITPLFHQIEALMSETGVPQAKNPVTILSVGRLSPNKNHADSLRAFAIYHKKYNPNSRLVLFGKQNKYLKAYVFELKKLAKILEIESGVVWVNGGSEKELGDYYSQADLFMTTSKHEGFCIPVAEAMAYGLPVIAFNYGAIPGTLGDSGILIKENTPEKMAVACHVVMTHAETRKKIIISQKDRYDALYRDDIVKNIFLEHIQKLFNSIIYKHEKASSKKI